MKYFLFIFMLLSFPVKAQEERVFIQPSSFNENEVIIKKLDEVGNVIPEESETTASPIQVKQMKKVVSYDTEKQSSFDKNLTQKQEGASSFENFSSLPSAEPTGQISTFSTMETTREKVEQDNMKLVECQSGDKNCEAYIVGREGEVLKKVSTFGGYGG